MEIALIISALGFGFATGFHCLGMCGPIAMALGLSKKQQVNFHIQNISYQFGRIFTYAVLGVIVGIVGEGFQMAGLQKYVSILAGVLLIVMAVFSFSGTDFAQKIPLVNQFLFRVKMNLGKLLSKTDYSSRFLTGVLNGFLPCGMVYMALTASLAAGGIWQSSLFMVLFGLGTFPFMFVAVLFGNMINAATRSKVLKIIPIFMLVLGGVFIVRGMEVGIPYISPKKESLQIQKPNSENSTHESCH